MPILFSAVAQSKSVVSEFASCDGNFIEIMNQMVSKIPLRDDKMTYFHGPYLIHYIMEYQHLYFCITDKTCQRSRAFLFLNEIQRRYKADSKTHFTEVLASLMYTYSEDYGAIVVRKGELDELNKIGVESSETILGEKILFVNNPEVISYATVSNVEKSLEQVPIFSEKLNITSSDIKAKEEISVYDITTDVADPKAVDDISKSPNQVLLPEEGPETVTDADKDTIQLSMEKSRLYIIVIGALILIGLIFALSPMTCVVVVGVIGCSFVKCFRNEKKSD